MDIIRLKQNNGFKYFNKRTKKMANKTTAKKAAQKATAQKAVKKATSKRAAK